jgi:hypothetical protein
MGRDYTDRTMTKFYDGDGKVVRESYRMAVEIALPDGPSKVIHTTRDVTFHAFPEMGMWLGILPVEPNDRPTLRQAARGAIFKLATPTLLSVGMWDDGHIDPNEQPGEVTVWVDGDAPTEKEIALLAEVNAVFGTDFQLSDFPGR